MLHSCLDLDKDDPQNAINDKQCMQVLSAYTVSETIGYGASGIAFRIAKKGDSHPIVIKISRRTPVSELEIRNACLVDNMLIAAKTQDWATLFCRTFGWTMCNNIPADWIDAISNYIEAEHVVYPHKLMPPIPNFSGSVICLVSEICGGPIWSRKFKAQEIIPFLFEVFYALKQAYDTYGFIHNDLNLGNILFQENARPPRDYEYNGKTYHISTWNVPRIIDFGHATFHPDKDVYELGGTKTSVTEFLRMLKFVNPEFDFIDDFDHPMINTFDALLRQPCFDILIVKKRRTLEVSIGCRACHRPATQCFEHASSYMYCNDKKCIRQLKGIASIIKVE
jgi:serine/threonine protein kinase